MIVELRLYLDGGVEDADLGYQRQYAPAHDMGAVIQLMRQVYFGPFYSAHEIAFLVAVHPASDRRWSMLINNGTTAKVSAGTTASFPDATLTQELVAP